MKFLMSVLLIVCVLGSGVAVAAPPPLTPAEKFARTPAGKKLAKEVESQKAELRQNVTSVFLGSGTRESVVATRTDIKGRATGFGTSSSTESHYRYTFKPKAYDMAKVRGEFAERANVRVVANQDPNVLDDYGEDMFIAGWEAMIASNGKVGSWPMSGKDARPITIKEENK